MDKITMPPPPPRPLERKEKPLVPPPIAATVVGALADLPPGKPKDDNRAAGPLAAPAMTPMPPPPLPPRKLKDNDNALAFAGTGGGCEDGMIKNPLTPMSIVLFPIIFPPLDGTVVAVVVGVADVRKLKADPIIANSPSLEGGEEHYPPLCSAIPGKLPRRMPTSQPTFFYMHVTLKK